MMPYISASFVAITGAILIEIPEGEHILELKFTDTPVRYYGKLISLISLLSLSCFVLKKWIKK